MNPTHPTGANDFLDALNPLGDFVGGFDLVDFDVNNADPQCDFWIDPA